MNTTSTYDSLASINSRKEELQKELENSNKEVKALWGALFEKKKETMPKGPVQRFMKYASKAPAVIDGAILGWKLYRSFKKK